MTSTHYAFDLFVLLSVSTGVTRCEMIDIPYYGIPEVNWVELPGGEYMMGCSSETYCTDDEIPYHKVYVNAFAIMDTEATINQFKIYSGGWIPGGRKDCGDCPVTWVEWRHANDFCETVGGRLPTEAEWEYAARAGSTTIFYCGDDPSCLGGIAWYDDNSDGHSQRVASLRPNSFGLYDMLGNAAEWTADWAEEDYYKSSPVDNPKGPEDGEKRVGRGGDYFASELGLDVHERTFDFPNDIWSAFGIRCVRDL